MDEATAALTPADQARAWLQWLYGDDFEGNIWIGGHANWRGERFTDVDSAVEYGMALDERNARSGDPLWGVYHRLTTVNDAGGKRGTDEDSVTLPAFMLDLDLRGPGHKSDRYPETENDLRLVLADAGLPEPSTWVRSGGGMYSVWKLATPLYLSSETELERGREYSRSIFAAVKAAGEARGWKVDNTSDPSRVYRLPGTMNNKSGGVRAAWSGQRGEVLTLGQVTGKLAIPSATPKTAGQESSATLRHLAPPSATPPVGTSFSSMFGGSEGGYGERRAFTVGQAMEFVRPALDALRSAEDGEINVRLNEAACALAHFGEEFWGRGAAEGQLFDALNSTEYDGRTWKAEDTIDSAYRGMESDWRATLVAAPPASPEEAVAQAVAAGEVDPVAAMLAEMIGFEAVSEIPPPKHLIHGLLQFDSESWLIGAPGSKKSFVALDMAARVARGEALWQGRAINPADVVMIVAEGAGGMGKRVKAWRKRFGEAPGMYILPRPVQAAQRAAGETRVSAEWQILSLACERLAASAREKGRGLFVIIDTQARVTVGLNENAAEDMGHYIEAVRLIRSRTGACVLSVHHTGRAGGDARGSSAIDGAQTTELKVESKPKTVIGRLIVEKQKDMEEIEPIRLGFEVVDLGMDSDGRPVDSLVLADQDSAAMRALWDESAGGAPLSASEAPILDRVDVEQWIRDRTDPRANVQRWIVQTLVDTAETLGLTQSEVRGLVKEKCGQVDISAFRRAWQAVTDEGGKWVDIVIRASGERWRVDRDEVDRHRE